MNWYGGAQYYAFAFYDMLNPGKYALGDVRVRKALQLGINSQEIADKILGGYGEPYPFFGADSAADFWDSNVLKPDPFDPEGAKKLLSDAGYPNGFDTRIYDTGAGGVISTMNQALSGDWRKIGVNAATVPIEYGAMVPMFVPKQLPEIWNSFYTSLGSQIHGFEKMASVYHSTRGSLKNIRNLKLDDLIDKVPTVSDPAERNRLSLEAVLLAKNEYSGVKIVAAHTVVAVGARIGDLTPYKDVAISGLLFETVKHAK